MYFSFKRLEILQSDKITSNEYLKVTFLLSQLKPIFLSDQTVLNIHLNLANQQSADLKGSSLQKLDKNAFNNFNKLKSVDASFNRFNRIDEETFKDLENLNELDISRNQILTVLPSFSRLFSLLKLNISFLQISIVHANILQNLVNLKIIDLSNNYGLTKIEPGLFNELFKLTDIDISSCALTSIDNYLFKGKIFVFVFKILFFKLINY